MRIRLIVVCFFVVCFVCAVFGQGNNLTVQLLTGTHIDTVLNHYLAGEGVQLTNGKFNNHPGNINSNQIGTFQRNGFTQFPIQSGLVMCTGSAMVAQGPNGSASASIDPTSSYYESALNTLASNLYDCAALDFDFMTNSDTFVFRYVFASEEYCEYVYQGFNDIFAFFLTGPDPVTLLNTTRNVAIIPGSVSASNPNGIPVAIDNVNHGYHGVGESGPGTSPSYSQYFVHNSSTTGTQFDGYTVALEAGGPIAACVSYHMKLAIGDVGDGSYDSGVFLEEHSFESAPDPSLTMDGFFCLHDDIVFQYQAQNVDSIHIVTPSGETLWNSPFVIADALEADSGYYYLWAKKGASCNGSSWMKDSVHIEIHVPCVSELCGGTEFCAGNVMSYPYAYDSITGPWVSYVSNNMFTISPPATLTADTTVFYSLSMYDQYNCHFDTTVQAVVHVQRYVDIDSSVCNSCTWNGVTYNQSGNYTKMSQTSAGCDSVTTLHLTVHYTAATTDTLYLVQNQLPYYFAPADTTFAINSPTSFQFVFTLPSQYQCDSVITQNVIVYQNVLQTIDTVVCPSSLPIVWHGLTFTGAGIQRDTLLTSHGADSVIIYQLTTDFVNAAIGQVTHVLCYGASTGGAMPESVVGQPPLSYQWTNAAGEVVSTSQQLASVPAGNYSLTVTDGYGCTASASVVILSLNDPLQPGVIDADQDVCLGELAQPFIGSGASGGDNGHFQWQISTNGTTWTPAPSTNNQIDYQYPDPVMNSFEVRRAWITQSCGTTYSDTLQVTARNSFYDTISDGICQGQAYSQYGFDISEEMNLETGTFTYEQHFSNGYCDSVIVLHLTVYANYEVFLEDEVCEGEGYSQHGFAIPNAETVGVDSLNRTLSFQSSAGCDSTVHLQLTFVDTTLRIVSLTEDFCEKMSSELMVVTNFSDYVWSTGEQSPNITVTFPGIYGVTASQGGCRVTARYVVEGCDLHLYLPNAITPTKNDGLNDFFSLPEMLLPMLNDFEISIFDRWGVQVYYSTDRTFRWRGEVDGAIAVNSVFNYIIRYKDINGKPFVVTGQILVL